MSKPTKEITVVMTEYTGHTEGPTFSQMSKKEHDGLIASYKKQHPKATDREAEKYVQSIKATEDKIAATQQLSELPRSGDNKISFSKMDNKLYFDEFMQNAKTAGNDGEKLMKLFDRDGDKYVEKEEIAAVLNAIDSKDHKRFEALLAKGSKLTLSSIITAAQDAHISSADLGKMSPHYTLNVQTKSQPRDVTYRD